MNADKTIALTRTIIGYARAQAEPATSAQEWLIRET
jgi:hypothetical protein